MALSCSKGSGAGTPGDGDAGSSGCASSSIDCWTTSGTCGLPNDECICGGPDIAPGNDAGLYWNKLATPSCPGSYDCCVSFAGATPGCLCASSKCETLKDCNTIASAFPGGTVVPSCPAPSTGGNAVGETCNGVNGDLQNVVTCPSYQACANVTCPSGANCAPSSECCLPSSGKCNGAPLSFACAAGGSGDFCCPTSGSPCNHGYDCCPGLNCNSHVCTAQPCPSPDDAGATPDGGGTVCQTYTDQCTMSTTCQCVTPGTQLDAGVTLSSACGTFSCCVTFGGYGGNVGCWCVTDEYLNSGCQNGPITCEDWAAFYASSGSAPPGAIHTTGNCP